ncbi:MAG: serine/threonine protein kinase [Oscillospiraceae bacterium]|jgi:serine/threonine-protein kinase|nr:serine/threonine protein kinase [Oscillospiraceae bacterium]
MANIGDVVAGRYKLLKEIKRGGMNSIVYLAEDTDLAKKWAVKEVVRGDTERFISHAVEEAELQKIFDHPNIPRIVAIVDGTNHKVVVKNLKPSDSVFIVMDYVSGDDFKDIVSDPKRGKIKQEDVIKYAKVLCSVLTYLHSQSPPIIYRDMKPENIKLQDNGEIRLLDYGIAVRSDNIGALRELTLGYASPEQVTRGVIVDQRSDIFCLGRTLYYLLTGITPQYDTKDKSPLPTEPIRKFVPDILSGLDIIIQKCTKERPENRYQSCQDVLNDLENYLKIGDDYIKQLKNKIKSIIIYLIIVISMVCVGMFSFAMRNSINNDSYDKYLQQAEKSASYDDKIYFYEKASEIKPLESEPYTGLINTFKTDGVFTEDESSILQKRISSNSQLKKSDDYATIAYKVGILYWFYYDYGKDNGDNEITRMSAASVWFDDAVSYGGTSFSDYKAAKVYADIGKFNKDIKTNVAESSDKGQYAPYFNNITKLVNLIGDNPNDDELVSLELYKLTIDALESYARKFKADGISEEEMISLLNNVQTNVVKVEPSTDKTIELKEVILSRVGQSNITLNTIQKAYN